jgi:hypothetical protein
LQTLQVEESFSWKEFMNDWHSIVLSTQPNIFEEKWNRFKEKYDALDLTTYFENTWIPWKENFVCCWINVSTHLGGHTSSRVKSAHSALKKYMVSSTGDLLQVKKSIEMALLKQMKDFEDNCTIEKTKCLNLLNNEFFSTTKRKLSRFALR